MSTTDKTNEPAAAATVPHAVADELRRAAVRVRAIPGCEFREDLADWLRNTADNMDDEDARVVTGDCVDGGTYVQVVTDGLCHLGLTWEWTSALLTARRINESQDAVEPAGATAQRVSDDRVQEILDGLNGFVSREYDGGTHLVNGAAVPCATVVGCDANVDKAIEWAEEQIVPGSVIANVFGPDTDGSAEVELADGTVIKWFPTPKQWAVTVSDDAEAVTA